MGDNTTESVDNNLAEMADEAIKIIDEVYSNIAEQAEKDLIKTEPEILIPVKTEETKVEEEQINDPVVQEQQAVEQACEPVVSENVETNDINVQQTEELKTEEISSNEEAPTQVITEVTQEEAVLNTEAPVVESNPIVETNTAEETNTAAETVEVVQPATEEDPSIPEPALVETAPIVETSESIPVEQPAQMIEAEAVLNDQVENPSASNAIQNDMTEPAKQEELPPNVIRTRKGRIIELPKQEPPAFMLVKLRKVTNINYTY